MDLGADGGGWGYGGNGGGWGLLVGYSDPGRLYMIDTTTLAATLIARGSFDAAGLAVDSGTVYLADETEQRLLTVALATGATHVATLCPAPPFDVKADAGAVWFTTTDPARLYAWKNLVNGFYAGALRPRTPITLDAQYLYWSSPGVGILRHAR